MIFPNDPVGDVARAALATGNAAPGTQAVPASRQAAVTIRDNGDVDVRSPYDAALTEQFRQIPGRRWTGGVNRFPSDALPRLVALLDEHGYAGIGDDVRDAADAEAQRQVVEEADAALRRAASEATDADVIVDGLGGDLMPFQRAGVAYALERRRVIVGDEMGLGKTVQALAAVQAADAFPVVVVCPASLKINWQREVERWLPGRRTIVLGGSLREDLADELGREIALHPQVREDRREDGEHLVGVPDVPTPDNASRGRVPMGPVDAAPDLGEPLHQPLVGVSDVEPPVSGESLQAPLAVDDPGEVAEVSRVGRQVERDARPSGALPGDPEALAVHEQPRAGHASLLSGLVVGGPGPDQVHGQTLDVGRDAAAIANADVLILNYDVVWRGWAEALASLRYHALILDESHMLKSGKTRRTKATRALADRVPRSGMVLLLTGTAVVNAPAELLPQLQILGRIAAFGGARQFRRDFCSFDGWGWSGSHHERDLHQRLRETCYVRRTKAQVLTDLPPKRWADVTLDRDRLDLRAYEEAERDLIRFLAESARLDAEPGQGDAAAESAARRARAAEALVRLTTLRRLAAVAKAPAAVEWARDLVESGEKVVIFAHHREALDAVATALDAPMIIGGQSLDARDQIVDRFQHDDDCRVIVSSIKAGGVGLTLTAASNVAFVEQDWTPAGMSQAADRCHRIGQTDSVTAWILQVPDTIDERMAALLAEKRVRVDAILDGIEADSTEGEGSIVNDLLAGYVTEGGRS